LERDNKVFSKNQSILLFSFDSSFQNCFWNLFSFFGLSQICKIRNALKLPSSFSRNTLILIPEKTIDFKNIILKVKLSNKFKNDYKYFSRGKSLHGFGNSCLDIVVNNGTNIPQLNNLVIFFWICYSKTNTIKIWYISHNK
jgi:hypothetical protein